MEIVAFWIAIWGAIWSTVLGVIRFIEFRRNRANIRVKVTYAYSIYGDTVSRNVHLCLTAINRGRRRTKLEAAGLSLSDGGTIPFVSDVFGNRFPKELDGTDSTEVLFDVSGIKNVLKENPGLYITHAWFRDRIGNYHNCKLSTKMVKELRS